MKTVKVLISIDISTDSDLERVEGALRKGIYYGLDVQRVSAPKNVKINYIQER